MHRLKEYEEKIILLNMDRCSAEYLGIHPEIELSAQRRTESALQVRGINPWLEIDKHPTSQWGEEGRPKWLEKPCGWSNYTEWAFNNPEYYFYSFKFEQIQWKKYAGERRWEFLLIGPAPWWKTTSGGAYSRKQRKSRFNTTGEDIFRTEDVV